MNAWSQLDHQRVSEFVKQHFSRVQQMSVTIKLPTDLESRIRTAAEEANVRPEEYTLRLLETHVPNESRRKSAIALIEEWLSVEQEDNGDVPYEQIFQWIDEDRSSPRKHFPPELKGIAW